MTKKLVPISEAAKDAASAAYDKEVARAHKAALPAAPLSFLGRPVVIDICKDGTFTMRMKTQKPFNGVAMPVFSTRTFTEAESLQVVMCFVVPNAEHDKLPKGMPWYKVNMVRGKPNGLDIEDLAELSFAMAARYQTIQARAREYDSSGWES